MVLTVASVQPGSPADAAGLKTGDTLLKVGDQKLLHPVQLRRLVGAMAPGRDAALTVHRRGQTIALQATLARRPAVQPGDRVKIRGRWPEGFAPHPLIEPLDLPPDAPFQDLQEMRQLLQKRLEQLAPQGPGMDPLPLGPGADAAFEGLLEQMQLQLPELGADARAVGRSRSVQVIRDGQHRITVTTDGRSRRLQATDADGNVLFDVPVSYTHLTLPTIYSV